MKWRHKALAFRILQNAPDWLYYFVQRKITKSVPRNPKNYGCYLDEVRRRRDTLQLAGPLAGKILLEFGAGWDLFHNIVLYAYGVDWQILVDLNPHMRPDLVNGVIAELMRNPPKDAIRELPGLLGPDAKGSLAQMYGIDYRAPADARALDLPDSSVDFVATTNTLEHIPFESLRDIMLECRRVCRPDGYVCMQIDYSDHYSHSDSSITPYNFLQFAEPDWARFNPSNHYQNRRRHIDYRKLFVETGYKILREDCSRPEHWKALLESVRVDSGFRDLAEDEIGITSGTFLLNPGK